MDDPATSRRSRGYRPGPIVDDTPWALAHATLEPAPASARRLLVLLHGVGGDVSQLAPLGARCGRATRVVLARGPRSLPGERLGWFHVAFGEGEPRVDEDEAEDARRRVVEFVAQLQARHGLGPEATVVAGFSQGGVLAASAALTAADRVAGFAVLCGRLLPGIAERAAPRADLASLSALVVHGRRDDVLGAALAERAHATLGALGVASRLGLHDAAHELVPPMVDDFVAWYLDAAQRWNADA